MASLRLVAMSPSPTSSASTSLFLGLSSFLSPFLFSSWLLTAPSSLFTSLGVLSTAFSLVDPIVLRWMLAVGGSWPSTACPYPWSWPCPCPCRRQRPCACAWCTGRRSGSRLATPSSCPPNSPSTVLRGSPLNTCGSMVCG
eukprot:8021712-Alexandrium_andersonii.AAC.1